MRPASPTCGPACRRCGTGYCAYVDILRLPSAVDHRDPPPRCEAESSAATAAGALNPGDLMNDSLSLYRTAEQRLLEPFGLTPRKLEGIFGQLFGHSVDFADLYFQYSRSEGWSLEEGIVKSGSFNIEQGVGVRAISGDKTAFAYSDDISFNALQDAAKATRAIASAGQSRKTKAGPSKLPAPLYREVDPVASLGSAQKVALLERLERKCRALDPRVSQVMASLGGEYEVVLIARADGRIAADVRP